MSDHLPECDSPSLPGSCICPELRACEQRVRARYSAYLNADNEGCYAAGFRDALDAAREAVAGLPVIKEWWEAKGDYVHGIEDALAAIDALSENPDDLPVSENPNDAR